MQTQIGYVTATVKFPLYEGDDLERDSWEWFEYAEPGITADGSLGVCRRACETLESSATIFEQPAPNPKD